MHPNDEVLAALAMGAEVDAADRAHVQGCEQCTAAVAELVQVSVLVREAQGVELAEPPTDVWTRVASEIGMQQHQQPAATGSGSDAGQARWSRRAWLVGAAAAGVAVGVAAAQLLPRLTQPQPRVLLHTTLETLDTSQQGGQATLTAQGGGLELTLRVAPLDAGSGFLEVWLINVDLKRMVSIGVLPAGTTQQAFPVPDDLVDQGYRIVDISRELFDDRPQHSGDSLLRGTLS